MARTISEIAREIRRDWTTVNYAAVPYLQAMQGLGDITDSYGEDSARSIVAYFLGNATTWCGETAKRIKVELKALSASGAEKRRLSRQDCSAQTNVRIW